MTDVDQKRVLAAALAELENKGRIITRLEIENDELKKKIKELTPANCGKSREE